MPNSKLTYLEDRIKPWAARLSFCLVLGQFASCPGVFAQQSVVREHIAAGNSFLRHLEFQKAIDEYEAVLKVDPANPTAHGNLLVAHNNWGIYCARQKKYDEALAQFQKVLELDPNFGDAKRNIDQVKRDMAREVKDTESPSWEPEAEKSNEKGKKSKNAGSPIKENKGEAENKPEPPAAVLLTPSAKTNSGVQSTQENSQSPGSEPANYGSNFFQSGPPNSSQASATIDEQLAALEMKVYGTKQVDTPVIKRIEKLEQDTQGQPGTGTIQERLGKLKASYGLK